jgi:CheY-like chemotaxis protein
MRHRTGDWTNCKKIKSDDPLVPIIAIIDYDNVDDEQAMRAKGIDDFLLTPLNSSKIFDILKKYLETSPSRTIN